MAVFSVPPEGSKDVLTYLWTSFVFKSQKSQNGEIPFYLMRRFSETQYTSVEKMTKSSRLFQQAS